MSKEGTTENYLAIGNETNNLIDLKKKILGNSCTLIKTLILKSKQFDIEFSFQEKKNERKEIKGMNMCEKGQLTDLEIEIRVD